jgi:hypothetical protein
MPSFIPTGFSGPARRYQQFLAQSAAPKKSKKEDDMASGVNRKPLNNKQIQQGTGPNATSQTPRTDPSYLGGSANMVTQNAAATPPFDITDRVGLNGGNTRTMTGFAHQYAPGMVDQIYNNPEILAQDTLAGLGYNGNYNSGMMPQLTNIATAALPLSVILAGGALPTNNATLNFGNDLLQQSMTPGGQYIDPNAALQAIFGTQAGQPLYSQLAGPGMTADQQSSALNSYIAASIGGLNPVAQNAVMNSLDQAKLDYARAIATGNLDQASQPYFQYVANNNVIPGFSR